MYPYSLKIPWTLSTPLKAVPSLKSLQFIFGVVLSTFGQIPTKATWMHCWSLNVWIHIKQLEHCLVCCKFQLVWMIIIHIIWWGTIVQVCICEDIVQKWPTFCLVGKNWHVYSLLHMILSKGKTRSGKERNHLPQGTWSSRRKEATKRKDSLSLPPLCYPHTHLVPNASRSSFGLQRFSY